MALAAGFEFRTLCRFDLLVDENPRGFGFLQRDRNFDHYEDDDQHCR